MTSRIQPLIETLEAGGQLTSQEVNRALKLQALGIARAGELYVDFINEKEKELNEQLRTLNDRSG
jgi:hypothetical protein